MILQNLKEYNRFDNLIIYFVVVLRIIKDENRLRRGDKYLNILIGFIYYVRVIFLKHTLLFATRGK
ncbi:hypothetical protein BKA65DRAFT_392623 [Rhexocercosporidium sp. MPI-PUGE-AT-0058]|nr:hypothetical protein BKA65DRAFT_392623 [Rhexocercosporidium sp. MPI-PUGE-AT-0058]